MDTTWTLETRSRGTLTFDGAVGSTMPTFGVGRNVELTLFVSDSTQSSFDTAREYARYTNDETNNVGTDIRGDPWYHESIHPSADFESALVRVTPGADVGDLRSWWCIIEDASIQTTAAGSSPRIILDLFVLASYVEYGERSLVVDDFSSAI